MVELPHPIPEVDAYLNSRKTLEYEIHRTVNWLLGIVAVAALLALTFTAVSYYQLKTQVTNIEHTVNAHTATLNCQNKGYEAIVKDARLALTGDKNVKDYAKAPKGC